MMRSLSSAVAGLRTHQTKMDVIGNNIANVNTYGFKGSRTTFADVYYQNLASGRRGLTATRGGTNPTQIGYGSSVATIDVMQTVAGAVSTGKPLDVYITGEGFLVSKDVNGNTFYSRLGNMTFDEAGNLVDGSGNRIMGFPMDANGNPVIPANGQLPMEQLNGIWVSPDVLEKLKSINVSNTGAITGLMDGDQQVTVLGNVPAWLNGNSVTIPATSTYNGVIRLAISGFCTYADMAGVLGLTAAQITNMEMGTLALPEAANYRVSVDRNGNVTMSLPANPPDIPNAISLTGALRGGKLVLADKDGNVGMTISFDDSVTSLQTTLSEQPDTTRMDTSTVQGSRIEYFTAPATPGDPPHRETNANGIPLFVTAVPAGDPRASGTEVLDSFGDPYNPPMYAAHPLVDVDNPATLSLSLFQQMTTTDKGGNIVKIPDPPEPFTAGTGTVSYGDLSFEITGTVPAAGYNAIIGTAEPGESIIVNIGNLVLAKFRNAQGLDQSGTSYFVESLNSGEPIFVVPGLEGTGGLKANYLEMSNVDVAQEFTDMITTQRGFQANSRIISVSDEMLQELVNLKR